MGRTFKIFILGASAVIRASFSVFANLLDEFTTQKINMLNSSFAEVLLKYVDANCLQKRHGGLLPDITENYWPPEMSIEG